MLLRTHVSANASTSQMWSAAVGLPGYLAGAGTVVSVGDMTGSELGAEYQWRVYVQGSQLRQAGNYTLFVYFKSDLHRVPSVQGNGSRVTIYPGPPAVAKSSLQLHPTNGATSLGVGDPVAVVLALQDEYDNPALAPRNVSVALTGPVSRRTLIAGTNFTRLGQGRFSYLHTLEAQELLTASLYVTGVLACNATLNVTAAAPAALDLPASLSLAEIQLYGIAAAMPPNPVVQGPALVSHRLWVPVMRVPSGRFGGDPGLRASVVLSGQEGQPGRVFNGSWSGANRSYVVFFRAPSTGMYSLVLELQHPADQQARASKSFSFTATRPLATNGSLSLEAAQTRVGDQVFLTASLFDQTGQPAPSADGATLTVRGNVSGLAELPLTLAADGARLWRVRYTFSIQESLIFQLSILNASGGSILVSTRSVIVEGVAPGQLDLRASLAAACIGNIEGAGTGCSTRATAALQPSVAAKPGVEVMAALGKELTIDLPVFIVSGEMWQSDPGLRVVVLLVPSARVDDINVTYGAALAQASLRRRMAEPQEPIIYGVDKGAAASLELEIPKGGAHGRELLQTYGSTYGGVQVYEYESYTGEFADENAAGAGYDLGAYDFGEEPGDPWAVEPSVVPAPPLNLDSPDAPNTLQDRLAQETGVLTFRGTFSTYQRRYQVPLQLSSSDTYLAVLSVRHPGAVGSLRLTTFWISVMDLAQLRSTASDTTNSPFVEAVNPWVAFDVTLPTASVTSYPGGAAAMLDDYRSLLAAQAGLSSTDNVYVAASAGTGPDSSAVVLAFKVWFDAGWKSQPSSFASVSSLEWFYFRLENQPAQLLTDATNYPALTSTGLQVFNLSVSEPFATVVKSAFTTTESVTGISNTTSSIIFLSFDVDTDPAAASGSDSTSAASVVPAATLSSPPVLSVLGEPYVEVTQPQTYTDPGVYVYDQIDGFDVEAHVTVRVCVRQANLAEMMFAVDAAAHASSVGTPASVGTSLAAAAAAAAQAPPPAVFVCSNSSNGTGSASSLAPVYPSGDLTLNTSILNMLTQMFLLTYSAVNSRGVAAAPRYRAVVVQPRCNVAAGEVWCPSLAACSVGGSCDASLAAMGLALTEILSAETSSGTSAIASLEAAASAAAGALTAPDPTSLSVVSTPDGGLAVISADGRSTWVDPMTYQRTSLPAPNGDPTDTNYYGILGNLMTMSGGSITPQPVYVRDTLPPLISILGAGQRAVTPRGLPVMIDTVEVGTHWTDQGATARDAVDGDLTPLLQTYGIAAVDTSRPTPAGKPYSYMIDYQVADLTGNLAQPAHRLIRLVCPANGRLCTDSDGLPACTTGGMCGLTPGATSATSTSNDTTSQSVSPQLTLVGPAVLTITQGVSYDRCTALLPLSQPCEPGAVGTDPRDGSLDLRVRVCGVQLRASRPGQALLPLLAACKVSTAVPGNYSLIFNVSNSAGAFATATRTLVVQPGCPPGESLCPGNTSCSEGGGTICKDDLLGSSMAATAAAAVTASTADASSIQLALITAVAVQTSVQVPRGGKYARCDPSADLTMSNTSPCEPGALAFGPDGANLTDRVVVCPPIKCLQSAAAATSGSNKSSIVAGGCSADQLRRHTLAAKGLAGCPINTMAPVGTLFYVDFWVWDDSRPPRNATVRRIVEIHEPCSDVAKPYFCADVSGGFVCSPSPCMALSSFMPPVTSGPSITLLPSEAPFFVEYGTPTSIYLGPCASAADTRSCGAIAIGAVMPTIPGLPATATDLSASITAVNTAPCNPGAGAAGCLTCTLEALAAGSSCMPGAYTFQFSVADEQGRRTAVNRTVIVFQSATVTASMTLLEGKLTDAAASEQLVAFLRNPGHPDYTSATQEVASRMMLYGVEYTDVDILSASLSPASPPPSTSSPASLLVSAAIQLFNPRGMHRAAGGSAFRWTASTSSTPSTSNSRRLLTAGDGANMHEASPGMTSVLEAFWQDSTLQTRRGIAEMDLALADPPTASTGATDPSVSACGHTGVGTTRATVATECPAKLARTLQQTSSGSSIAGVSSGTDPTLSALVASLAASLNASSTSIALPPGPNLTAVYTTAIAGLVTALAQSVAGVSSDLESMSYTIGVIMGDAAERSEADRKAAATAAFAALLTDFAAAENATMTKLDAASRLLEVQLSAQAAVADRISDLDLVLREGAALTRAQTDRALYLAMVVTEATGDQSEIEASSSCYRLQQTGFRTSFTVANFGELSVASTAASDVGSAAVSSPEAVGGRRRLQQSGGSGSSSQSNKGSIPWLGYVLTGGTASAYHDGYDIDVGVDLAAAAARPRYAGSGISNRVVGGLLLYTTRRPLLGPASIVSEDTPGAAVDAACNSSFADLDANCHVYDVAYLRTDTGTTSMLQRLLAGVNSTLAPYGVDPVFLRSSSLYREDLASRLEWYYNTSDPEQVSPTGTPYGFTARPLSGRPPGFPVLLEGGLSKERAADMIRFLADGNYLDRRQTGEMSAEMLVYNKELRAFAFFHGDFSWAKSGTISGRLTTVGFPAMTYLQDGQTLEDVTGQVFVTELLPLWILAIFFAVVTCVATISASARAARHAAAAAAAVAHERALTNALRAFELPMTRRAVDIPDAATAAAAAAAIGTGGRGSNGGGAKTTSEDEAPDPKASQAKAATGKGFKTVVLNAAADNCATRNTGAMPWAHAGQMAVGRPVGPAAGGGNGASHIRILKDEMAARREERLEFLGAANFSARRTGFREFVRHDGGLLYDIPLAALLIAVAIYWTVFVDSYLLLYNAQSHYRVYDASPSASARWLLSARTDPGTTTASPRVYDAAKSMGIDAPTAPGDPGRWLLGAQDGDWEALNSVLSKANHLVDMWTTYGMLQAVVIISLIAKLIIVMAFQSRLGIICRTLMTMFTPILHLVIIIMVLVVMLAAAANIVLGDRYSAVSSLPDAILDTLSHIVDSSSFDFNALQSNDVIMSGIQRFAAVLVLLTQVLLVLWVVFSFFFATMGHIFIKQKHSVDWKHTTSVPEDLALVVIPDVMRKLFGLLPGAASRRCRQIAARAGAQGKGDAVDVDAEAHAEAAAVAAASGCTPVCDDLHSPSNRKLLRTMATAGVNELLCAGDMAKTWNGRVRVAKVAGGRLLIDKAGMRQIMGTVGISAAATEAKLQPAGDDDTPAAKAGGVAALAAAVGGPRALALLVARRVMDRVGRTYGSKTPEYRLLAAAADKEAAARRRGTKLPSTAAKMQSVSVLSSADSTEPSSGPMSPPRRSLSTEIQIHLSIYDALHAAVESIVRWQSGVHRWQLRAWKQMASAYLFNQQLLAGLGVAPGPAFVERPRALQDEDLPHVAREARTSTSASVGPTSPPRTAQTMPPIAPLLPLRRPYSARPVGSPLLQEDSGVLSPSQLSVTESARRRTDGSILEPMRWASRSFASASPPPGQSSRPQGPSSLAQQLQQQAHPQSSLSYSQTPSSALRQSTPPAVRIDTDEVEPLGEADGPAATSPRTRVDEVGEDCRPCSSALSGYGNTVTCANESADSPPSTFATAFRSSSPLGPAGSAGLHPGASLLKGAGPSASIGIGSTPSRWIRGDVAAAAATAAAAAASQGSPMSPVVAAAIGKVQPSEPPAGRGSSFGHAFEMVPEEEDSGPEQQQAGDEDEDEDALANGPAKSLPSARNRARWGSVSPLGTTWDDMRERLVSLISRRSRRPTTVGGTGGPNSASSATTQASAGMGGAGSVTAGAGGHSVTTIGSGPRDASMVYNMAFSRSRRGNGNDGMSQRDEVLPAD